MTRLLVLVAFVVAIGPRTAAAQELDGERAPIGLHVNSGLEVLFGSDVISYGFRSHVGADVALGRGRLRPSIGVGATYGASWLRINDHRALQNSVTIAHTDVGPEIQLGLRWVDGSIVDNRVFVSFAYLFTILDERLRLDSIDGVGGTRGMRASVGLNWVDSMTRAMQAGASSASGNDLEWIIYLVPQQVEIVWERSAGSSRFGFTVGWGI